MKFKLYNLEERIVLDASGADNNHAEAHGEFSAALADAASIPDGIGENAADISPNSQPEALLAREILFVDPSAPGAEKLLDALRPGVEVINLSATQDGVAQIADALSSRNGLDAIHILSHGQPGQIRLGTSFVTASDLTAYTTELTAWGQALRPGGDILFYGCEIAANESGQALIQGLASATGADVAASMDLTGAAALSGNWTLEFQTGSIEAALPFDPSAYDTTLNFYGWARSAASRQAFLQSAGEPVFVDAAGNTYITGVFSGTVDFDPSTGETWLTSTDATNDVFILKLNADGTLAWARSVGGSGNDQGYGIAVDGSGNVVVTGIFNSANADFDPDQALRSCQQPEVMTYFC